jgi:Fur family transcriptional regulator, ferric uptake regulator
MISDRDLRQRGIRLTPQRHMILDAIAQSNGHMTVEEIYQRIVSVYPEMSISTVYRNLERLVDLRLVAVTDLGSGRICYEALGSPLHHHLICHRCGAISQLDDSFIGELRGCIAERYNFAAQIDHLAIWGLCSQCRTAGGQGKEGSHAHP